MKTKASVNHNAVQIPVRGRGLTVKTGVKAGRRSGIGNGSVLTFNHNETQVRNRVRGLTVKTGVKAGPDGPSGRTGGDWIVNHNETQVRVRMGQTASG